MGCSLLFAICVLLPSSAASLALLAPHERAVELMRVLQRPSGALTVSLECKSMHTAAEVSAGLRKANAATIWASDVDTISQLAEEQSTASADFPGPCPVIFAGAASEAAAAVAVGAEAIVLSSADSALAAEVDVPVIWKVSTPDEVRKIVSTSGREAASLFVVNTDVEAAKEVCRSLPEGALAIGAVVAMQAGNAEIDEGRQLTAAGVRALIVREACVGDEASRFVMSGTHP